MVDHDRRQLRKQRPATAFTSHSPRAPRPASRHHGKCARTTYGETRHTTLARYLRPLRRVDAAAVAALPPRPAPPTVRQVTGWITGLPGHLDPADAVRLHAIRARCPELDAAVRHVAGFARMIKDLSGDKNTLTGWMGAVDADLPVLRSFTAGLRRDLDAVVAGLTLEYNSGAVEGTVNRIKQLKTAMYGRANPDLLRKRILLA